MQNALCWTKWLQFKVWCWHSVVIIKKEAEITARKEPLKNKGCAQKVCRIWKSVDVIQHLCVVGGCAGRPGCLLNTNTIILNSQTQDVSYFRKGCWRWRWRWSWETSGRTQGCSEGGRWDGVRWSAVAPPNGSTSEHGSPSGCFWTGVTFRRLKSAAGDRQIDSRVTRLKGKPWCCNKTMTNHVCVSLSAGWVGDGGRIQDGLIFCL